MRACRAGVADLGEAVSERFGEGRGSDWADFLRLMDAQGIGPLASSALLSVDAERIPDGVRRSLQDRVQLGDLRAGMLVPELLEVVEALQARGVDVVAHKGPALSLLAYGRPGLRDSADLDLMVREIQTTAAEQALRERGYRRHSPGDLRPRLEAAWRQAWNETEYVSADGCVFVDLHWRVCPRRFPFRVDSPRLWSSLSRAEVDGGQVPVFPVETQIVLLAVHGAKDTWHKLVWLCDVDRLVRVSPGLDWGEVLAFAEEGRCRRAVGLCLLLAQRLFETPVPADVLARLAEDPALSRLAARTEGQLAAGGIPRPWWLAHFDLLPFHLEVFDGRRDGVGYVGRTLLTPRAWDWELVKVHLPDSLYALNYVLRPLRLLATFPREALRRLDRPGGP